MEKIQVLKQWTVNKNGWDCNTAQPLGGVGCTEAESKRHHPHPTPITPRQSFPTAPFRSHFQIRFRRPCLGATLVGDLPTLPCPPLSLPTPSKCSRFHFPFLILSSEPHTPGTAPDVCSRLSAVTKCVTVRAENNRILLIVG